MKLEELLDQELYAQVKAKIDEHNAKETDKLKHVRYADLSEGGFISKDKHTSVETDLTSKVAEIAKANGLIEELKKGTGKDEELQGKITTYETTVSDLQKQLAQEKVEAAVKIALLSSGCKDVDYISFKLKEKGELSLDDAGKVKGIEDRLTELKTQFPTQFASKEDTKIDEHKLPDDQNNKDNKVPETLAGALAEHYKAKE